MECNYQPDMVTARTFTLMSNMCKRMAIVFCALSCSVLSLAQQPVQPRGIARISIASLVLPKPASIARLSIASNQTLAPNAACGCISGCNVLPIELLSFEGRRLNEDQVMLNWETMNEFQNKGFEVQRSLSNERSFAPIAFVPSQTGLATAYSYQLPDNNSYMGISYYRLKQVDLDGRFTISKTIAIKGYGKQSTLSIYPNPVTVQLQAEIFALQKTKATLLLSDAAQRTLLVKNIVLNKGLNQFTVPAAHLTAGVYLLRVIPEQGTALVSKFIKL